jgi:hypothetical protein
MVQLTWSDPEIGVVKPLQFGWSDVVKSGIYRNYLTVELASEFFDRHQEEAKLATLPAVVGSIELVQ